MFRIIFKKTTTKTILIKLDLKCIDIWIKIINVFSIIICVKTYIAQQLFAFSKEKTIKEINNL